MPIVKRHPLAVVALIIILGMVIGVVGGWGMAVHETGEIARQVRAKNPRDPLDGLPFIAMGIMVTGFVLGTVTGIVGAVVFWLMHKARAGKEGVDSSHSHPVSTG